MLLFVSCASVIILQVLSAILLYLSLTREIFWVLSTFIKWNFFTGLMWSAKNFSNKIVIIYICIFACCCTIVAGYVYLKFYILLFCLCIIILNHIWSSLKVKIRIISYERLYWLWTFTLTSHNTIYACLAQPCAICIYLLAIWL